MAYKKRTNERKRRHSVEKILVVIALMTSQKNKREEELP
jgi:hypothetical protein